MKSNYKRRNWKIILINKRIRKKTNNNQNNKDQTWYKNQMLMDKIEKKSIKDSRLNILQ
jgi:hypothetical protein